MNVPLNWLSDYVKLPTDTRALTDRLTMIGHMLDKTKEINGETVIDLELRGNRADMFGLIGVARDISAAFSHELKLPKAANLPKTDPKSPLIKVEKSAVGLVRRYIAIELSVKVKSSPDWLINRLKSYGIEPINNVVDVTNYVMVETGHPLHAFDADKLTGNQLILRAAKSEETFATIQQGTTLTLTPQDLVIADSTAVQCLTAIGGIQTKITGESTKIILETAVYDPASVRRSARRLKIFTESSYRHEKHQDPEELTFSLARAIELLKETAGAKITSEVSDYYPHPAQPVTLSFDTENIYLLSGLSVPENKITSLLISLGFEVIHKNNNLEVLVPSFRTDVETSADLVEEIVRLVGYEHIPETPLSGFIPPPQTYPSFALQEKIRDLFVSLGITEAITSSMVKNELAGENSIQIINPPDPNTSFLRQNLATNLNQYAQKLINRRISTVRLFEIGKVFTKNKNAYSESLHLCVVIAGLKQPENWRTKQSQLVDIYDLKGIVDTFKKLIDQNDLTGSYSIEEGAFIFEAAIDDLNIVKNINLYSTVSQYPPIIEDINISLTKPYDQLEKKIYSISPLIKKIELIDKYGPKLTLRLTFHSSDHQLSSSEIAPIRQKLLSL